MLENKQLVSPEAAADMFFWGISMDQFLIAGSWPIEFVVALKGCYNLVYCTLVSPIGLLMRKYYEHKVSKTMKTYQPFKRPTPVQGTFPTRRLSTDRIDSGLPMMPP